MQKSEQRAICLTMLGNISMAVLGISFALYSSSDAILLDAFYSGINFLIALISLRVTHLIRQPDDEYYPFGYAIFEPVLNLGKGLIISGVAAFAFFSAVEVILAGGRQIVAGAALWYAIIAATSCMVLSVVQRRLARNCKSPIVELDAKNWFIDGAISGAVALAFGIVIVLEGTPLAWLNPYADPGLVIAIVLVAISIPLGTVRENWAQIVGRSIEPGLHEQVRKIVEAHLSEFSYESCHFRQGRLGRLVYVQVYILVNKATELTPRQADDVRSQLYLALQDSFPYLAADVIFTADRVWIRRAILPTPP